jgi:UDP-N-acetylglucosamine acyltransferase
VARVHPTAVVDRHAELASDVEVGPYCVLGPRVRIAEGTTLLGHVVVGGATTIGRGNLLHPFSVLGGEPQLRGGTEPPDDARRALVIGDENVIREHVTVNLASRGAATAIGSRNLLMTGCHVAHDVLIGSGCVIANGVQLAGHVVVEDWVTFGGLAAVAQHRRVGESAFVAGGAMCERDVPPFVIVQGDRARVRALNVVGLERRGIPRASILRLRRAFARLFVTRTGSLEERLTALDRSDPYVSVLARALARECGSAGRA